MTRGSVKNACGQETIGCGLFVRRIESAAVPASVTQVFSEQKYASILGGNNAYRESNRFSTWAAEPVEIFEVGPGRKAVFSRLAEILARYELRGSSGESIPAGMFCCGWIGYFGYELGRSIEKVPASAVDDLGLPVIRLSFYDRAVCFDHNTKTWFLSALRMPDDTEPVEAKLDHLASLVKQAEGVVVREYPAGQLDDIDVSKLRCNMNREYYFGALKRIRKYIYDGDVYQINFSQRFECDYTSDAIDLYHWQNEYNPSPYAAYVDAGDFAIVSASPEMFVTIADGIISTKPIKGTRPRLGNAAGAEEINQRNFTELVESEKDQAELNMIIDLERNDLTRICEYGSIKVVQPRTIEAYPTVFHAVATIEGRLREGRLATGFCDILKAMFPGGSITGAPKIRSMEIIDELEPTARSVYTGSIGFLGVDGTASLNIAIRTVIVKGKSAYVQTGGGIVADSDPNSEWEETITKARALLAGIAAVNA